MVEIPRLTPNESNGPNGERARSRAREHPAFKELWQVNFRALNISGESGTGKTTIAIFAEQIYGIPPERNIKIGELIRQRVNAGTTEDYMEREVEVDKEFDDLQRDIFTKRATLQEPFIVEGRLSAVIVEEEKIKNLSLNDIVSIGLTASLDVIVQRIKKRRPNLSDEEIRLQLGRRAEKDLERWTILHPQLALVGPYDPKRYDRAFDTNTKDVERVFDDIHNWLLEKRAIIRIGPKGSLQQGQILPSA